MVPRWATLGVAGGVNNAGTIGFETNRTSPGTRAYLDLSGTLDNSGLIESRLFEGSGPGSRQIQADTVINSGTIRQNDTRVSGGSFILTALNNATAVPEPGPAYLFRLAGFSMLAGRRRRRRIQGRNPSDGSDRFG